MTKTIVITGASAGIGAQAAHRLAAEGWDVAVVGRNAERTAAVATSVGGTPFVADYDRLDDVRALAAALLERYPRIDVLANNAGGLVSERGLTADGHERTLQHNHLAPFLLTNLLLPRLVESDARVVSTASLANLAGSVRLDDLEWKKRAWVGGWRAYGTVKLETILFIKELARRTPLEAFSFHPGYVSTGFGADSRFIKISAMVRSGGFGIPVAVGAVPLIQLATDEVVHAENGAYFDRLKANGAMRKAGADPKLASDLWDATATLVGL
jgi:NAD(P)-dependent dehydrogenase (short-subunit alcohol dehydrogenase family)